MTLLEAVVHAAAANALGWTLLHSVWQGAAVALALAAALARIRSPRTRYAAACAAMGLLVACFLITFVLVFPQTGIAHVATGGARAVVSAADAREWSSVVAETRGAADFLPWLAPFWIAGVLVFQLRTVAASIAELRLRRVAVCCAPAPWQQRLECLARRARVSRPVVLLESCLADVPAVIGCVRPVILVPLGMLAGLPAGQVEAILLHELAHIRRYDVLANLFQRTVEGLLFYHPAVWWMTAVVRAERESCCDDLAVAINGDAHEYALALTAVEQNRRATCEPAVAATGGSLVKRIRRILYQVEGPRAFGAPISFAAILTIAAVVASAAWPSKTVENPPAAQVTAGLERIFHKWLTEDVVYIITPEERDAFERLTTDAEREHFIEQFWLRRDPTPDSPENEFKEEHYRRIGYANEHFAWGRPGWTSDRGRFYIMWGPPDEIESHPNGGPAATYPYESWRYRYIDGVGSNVDLPFIDPAHTGEFRIAEDRLRNEVPPGWPGGLAAALFRSKPPSAQATVRITPDRGLLLSVPIEFDAKEYAVDGDIYSAGDWKLQATFSRRVTLCKNSPAEPGCLDQPRFKSGPMYPGRIPPGSYVLGVVVRDRAGTTQRIYRVDFTVD